MKKALIIISAILVLSLAGNLLVLMNTSSEKSYITDLKDMYSSMESESGKLTDDESGIKDKNTDVQNQIETLNKGVD